MVIISACHLEEQGYIPSGGVSLHSLIVFKASPNLPHRPCTECTGLTSRSLYTVQALRLCHCEAAAAGETPFHKCRDGRARGSKPRFAISCFAHVLHNHITVRMHDYMQLIRERASKTHDGQNTKREVRTHDHKVKGLALCRLS